MADIFSWVATAATVIAASITASNLGVRITGYGFIVFTLGSIAWFAVGIRTGQPALVWTNGVLTFLNLFGVWRWLGRQARIEDGAEAAALASRRTPGENLFPLSLLTKASVRGGDGSELGHSLDGMAGARSGRIEYLVVSEGGIGGVGETLRRIDWSDCHVEGERVVAGIDRNAFRALAPLKSDHWPAR